LSYIDWRSSADIATLKKRAQFLADARLFFAERNVLEVETPILSRAAPTAPYLDSFSTEYRPLASEQAETYYLHTSPEFAMKRLLAGGAGSIYQFARVFRNGEQGRLHSPEFTMLEWYRPELTLHQLMDEMNSLLQHVFGFNAILRMSYRGLFEFFCKLNIFECSEGALIQFAKKTIRSLPDDLALERDEWLDVIMSQHIERRLAALNMPLFVYDFPASQAQLAKVTKDAAGYDVAARFELYIDGVELANGYDELLDAEELRRRFEADNSQRRQLGLVEMPLDESLLAAMAFGLPSCSGVAMGFDRITMLALGKKQIADVQTMQFGSA
jgi:lysyl-tRNA synthetase class 2